MPTHAMIYRIDTPAGARTFGRARASGVFENGPRRRTHLGEVGELLLLAADCGRVELVGAVEALGEASRLGHRGDDIVQESERRLRQQLLLEHGPLDERLQHRLRLRDELLEAHGARATQEAPPPADDPRGPRTRAASKGSSTCGALPPPEKRSG
jgi:hypothetical protein